MSTVKFNEKEQKNMKTASKVLYVLGKIGKIIMRACMVFIIVLMIGVPIIFGKIEVKDNTLIYDKGVLQIKELNGGAEVIVNNKENVKVAEFDKKSLNEFKDIIKHRNKNITILLFELGLLIILITVYLVSNVFKYLEKLFININKEDTPFISDNVNYIKKTVHTMIACIILSIIGESFIMIAIAQDVEFNINLFNVFEIIFLYALALIFEYGYRIQKDSKAKMYGEIKK